ncbi:MAG: hypothetical protein R2685_15865 [Candidatus Nitrosocosmicus sp.]|nr:hypothetical protein [Candidatus Nitrosocosmicus sp.]
MGERHDYQIYKKNHPDLPGDVTSMYDLGFLGVERVSQAKVIAANQKGERM